MTQPTSRTGDTSVAARNSFPPGRLVWLWLLVIFVGVQFGAGLYEKQAIVPLWADVPPAQVLDHIRTSGMWTAGRAFWPFVSPVVAVLAVVNLVVARRSPPAYRSWWLAGAAVMVIYAVFSYSYFVPQMLLLQNSGGAWPPARVESLVDWWTGLNYLRMVIGAVGWLCALRALSLSASAGTAAVSGRGAAAR
jgi:Domain of unknown function (DUF1772)